MHSTLQQSRLAAVIRRALRGACFLVAVAGVGACSEDRASESYAVACRALGLCDEPPLAPVFVDILCDPSIGSTCNDPVLSSTVGAALHYVALRPRSHVRLWVLEKTVGDTVAAGEQVVPPRSMHGSIRTHQAQADRFVKTATDYLLTAARPALEAAPIRRSPLSEAISKIGMADSSGIERILVVLTDGREVSATGDFECGLLPTDKRFVQNLGRRSLLTPGLLKDVRVELAHVEGKPIPARGCAVQVDRELRIRALWTAALKNAGATEVRVGSGPPSFFNEKPQEARTEESE